MRHRGRTAYTDQHHFMPIQPAISPFALPLIWEFKAAYDVDTTNVWKETSSGSGTGLTVQNERGGFAKVTNGTSNNNFYFYESIKEVGRLQANKGLWFRTFMKIADADAGEWFIGLCARLASGNLFDNRVDAIGFYGSDGSVQIHGECRKDGTATPETGLESLADNAVVELGIRVNGITEVELYVNDGRKVLINTNLPDDEEMCFSFGVRNGLASANSMSVAKTLLLQDE